AGCKACRSRTEKQVQQEGEKLKNYHVQDSLEEAANDASARLHAALGDLSGLQEQLIPRREAHWRKVEAHLAERARLIKEDEDLEKEEHAIRLSKPHVYGLYDEYAAIMAWVNL
ncbi:hypothetical protein DUNSADRAFT_11929, partial [Dunaliella salina]